MHNPVTHYRFLLDGGGRPALADRRRRRRPRPAGHVRLPAQRLTRRPGLGAATRVVYQVFPDRFARSAAADDRPTPAWAVPADWDDEVVFEGTDPRTPRSSTAATSTGSSSTSTTSPSSASSVVYTTPVFPGESNHRYNASTFDAVDPLLGGDDAYVRLSAAVHDRGWRILGDLTTNHTGDTHEWFVAAPTRRPRPAGTFYYFRADGAYECWMGHATLPKLNHAVPALRTRDGGRTRLAWSRAGCGRRTTWTAGGSTWPT